jgi:hypothetical protein
MHADTPEILRALRGRGCGIAVASLNPDAFGRRGVAAAAAHASAGAHIMPDPIPALLRHRCPCMRCMHRNRRFARGQASERT